MSVTENKGQYRYPAGIYGLLLLYTGMRCGEMLDLRWAGVDFEHGILTIEKSRSVAKNRVGGKVQHIVELPEVLQAEENHS